MQSIPYAGPFFDPVRNLEEGRRRTTAAPGVVVMPLNGGADDQRVF